MLKKHAIFGSGAGAANNGDGYYPQDIRSRYNWPTDWDGGGQAIGILEFSSGYSLNDARQFWRNHGIHPPNVSFISVDGTRNDHGAGRQDEEASLDLQWAGALAPGAQLLVYEGNAGQDYASFTRIVETALRYILNDDANRPSVLSISYGDAEASFGAAAVQQWASLIQRLDEQGVTVCVASGDQGAYGRHQPGGHRRHVDAPASAPFAVAVGGTSLKLDGRETAWTYQSRANGGATGGGFSNVFPQPAYQSTLHVQASGRGLPDVALNADPATGYQIVFRGQNAVVGGTSVAAPVFAALVALANQRRAASGKQPLSGLTQRLYTNAQPFPYHDITVGNNSFAGVQGFDARPGWDACTGWGSVDAAKFVAQLAEL